MQTDKCPHGYWQVQFAHVQCPWCFGVNQTNSDVVPVRGPGNGWLLRRGQATCPGCAGPAGAGFGLLPPYMTTEYYEQVIKPQPRLCRPCATAWQKAGRQPPRVHGMLEHEVPPQVRAEAARRAAAMLERTVQPQQQAAGQPDVVMEGSLETFQERFDTSWESGAGERF